MKLCSTLHTLLDFNSVGVLAKPDSTRVRDPNVDA